MIAMCDLNPKNRVAIERFRTALAAGSRDGVRRALVRQLIDDGQFTVGGSAGGPVLEGGEDVNPLEAAEPLGLGRTPRRVR